MKEERQLKSKHLNVLIVKDENYSDESLNKINLNIRLVVGNAMEIEVSIVDEIEKESSGKIRAIVSNIQNVS